MDPKTCAQAYGPAVGQLCRRAVQVGSNAGEAAGWLAGRAGVMATRVEALVREAFRELGDWQASLRTMANQLRQLDVRSKRAVAKGREVAMLDGVIARGFSGHAGYCRTSRRRSVSTARARPGCVRDAGLTPRSTH